jgi:plasmid stabilization system protein ParE
MRRIIFTPEAEQTLDAQLDYFITHGAAKPAQALKVRVDAFVHGVLAGYPRTGRFISQRNLWETWIPATRLIVWYTFTEDELVLITFWHASQDRQG